MFVEGQEQQYKQKRKRNYMDLMADSQNDESK
jgi:hypothetical protein